MTALYCRAATVPMMITPVHLHLVVMREVLHLKIVDVRHVRQSVLLLARLEAIARHQLTEVIAVLHRTPDRSLLYALLIFHLMISPQNLMVIQSCLSRKIDTI